MTTPRPTPSASASAQYEPLTPETPPAPPADADSVSAAPGSDSSTAAATEDIDSDQRRRRDPAGEAAARRVQLREVEAERDLLASGVDNLRRQLIENILDSTHDLRGDGSRMDLLQRPADLWEVLGATPGQFFDADGGTDPQALAEFIAAGTADRAYLTRAMPSGVPPRDAVREAMERAGNAAHYQGGADVSAGDAWATALQK